MGTTFDPHRKKVKGQELESWLIQRLAPKLDFKIYCHPFRGQTLVIFEIPAASSQPTRFLHRAYVRIGSYTKKLNDFPEKEHKIWSRKSRRAFEEELAMRNVTPNEIIRVLDTQGYFDLRKLPYPSQRNEVISKFVHEKFIRKQGVKYHITNLGAILFAKNINEFESLARKAVRVIVYRGKNKVETLREQEGVRGYAIGFEGMIDWINSQLPSNEVIGRAFREDIRMYPEIAIRELVANALIHQDFRMSGAGPLVEIFSDRIVFSNPGKPLITTNRFIDEYQSRNEVLASFMRRIGICEEKGSGVDKVVHYSEMYQLPALDFQQAERHTRAILFSFKALNEMDKAERVRAVYQHACLCYVSNEKLTNQSLRNRFKIESQNSAIASRMIGETLQEGLIKPDDPNNTSRKHMKYIPFWA